MKRAISPAALMLLGLVCAAQQPAGVREGYAPVDRGRHVRVAPNAAGVQVAPRHLGNTGSDREEPFEREEYEALSRAVPPPLQPAAVRRSAWLRALDVPLWQDSAGNTPVWTCIGPFRLTNGWGGTDDAGRVSSIVVDPRNPDRVFIGASHGGVWRSVTRGNNWVPLTDHEGSLAYGSICLDPFNPDIIYAGTGEMHNSGDSYFGAGFLRSRDGGRTWELLCEDEFAGCYWGKLIASYKLRGMLLAATSYGLLRSLDGGTSWTKMLDGRFTDCVTSPKQPDIFYASGGTNTYGSLFKSTDSGNTWQLLSKLPAPGTHGRIQLGQCRDFPNTLYVAYVVGPSTQMYRTDDAGANWTLLPNAPNFGSWYNMWVAVQPNDPNVVYGGGTTFYRSLDGGNTWIDAGRTYQWGVHPDTHCYCFDPEDPSSMYVGTDGGMFMTHNRWDSWVSINDGLANVQLESLDAHPWDPNWTIGGTQDNGTISGKGDPAWRISVVGDGGQTIFNYKNPKRAYSEYVGLTMYSSDDGGDTWEGIADRLDRTGALFYAPFELDPNNPDILVAGAAKVQRTTDGALTWKTIGPDMGQVSALAVAPRHSDVIYAGNRFGKVWVTPDIGVNWFEISKGLPGAYLAAIAVDPRSPRRIIVGCGGYGTKHVFLSENAGGTWRSVDDNLPDAPVKHILIDPTRPDDVYVAMDCGVFVSNIGGGEWRRYGFLPNAPVVRMALNRRTGYLYCGTHGRSAWRIPLPSNRTPSSR